MLPSRGQGLLWTEMFAQANEVNMPTPKSFEEPSGYFGRTRAARFGTRLRKSLARLAQASNSQSVIGGLTFVPIGPSYGFGSSNIFLQNASHSMSCFDMVVPFCWSCTASQRQLIRRAKMLAQGFYLSNYQRWEWSFQVTARQPCFWSYVKCERLVFMQRNVS